jgi:two-component system LytT family response regulator
LADARDALAKPNPDRLLIRDSRGIIPVTVRDIERVEAQGDYVALRTRGRTVLVHLPLGDMEKRLDPVRFVRIHRSHLVNLDFVEAIEPIDNSQLLVRMKDGIRIAASRSASKQLRAQAL